MFIDELADRIELPFDAADVLKKTYLKVKDDEKFKGLSLMIEKRQPFWEIEKKCIELSKDFGIDKYTFMMTVLCSNADIMKKRFLDKNINEEIFWDSASDLKYKIIECKKRYGVWGIFPFTWYAGLFEARCFKLGRLEFEEKTLSDKTKVINIHIPSCGPLKHDDVIDSYKRAYDFFEKTHESFSVFVCSSYLVFPMYKGSVFKEGTNTYKFADDFNILKVKYTEEFNDAWRVFYTDYNGDVSLLPCETSMQKAFSEYLKNGGKVGTGFGAFAFDGIKIYKKEAEIIKDVI